MIRAVVLLALIAGFAFPSGASARESHRVSRRTPTSVAEKTLIKVVNGDQVSEFELVGRKLKFSNPTQRREVELTQQDLKEVYGHLAPLTSADSHDKRLCGRIYLEADTKKGRKTLCLKSSTSGGKASYELARLLALIVKIR